MLISNEKIEVLFQPFKASLGELYIKVCNDAKALYGRVDKEIKAEGGDWKVKGKVEKGTVANKAVYTLLLPLNNPLTSLTLASLDIRELYKKHVMEVESINLPLPKACLGWHKEALKEYKEALKEPSSKTN